MTAFELRHFYARPLWLCTTCEELWPCPEAQRLLLAEFDGKRLHLRLLMGMYYSDALNDLTDYMTERAQYQALNKRFFGWLSQPQIPLKNSKP